MAIYSDENPLPRPTGRSPAASSSRKARGRALAFMMIALVAAGGAGTLVVRFVAAREAAAKSRSTLIAVAAMDIPLATSLRPDLIKFIDWPSNAIPPGAFTDAKALENRVISRDVLKGEPILESRLAGKGTGLGMAAVIPANMRAMTVQVSESTGVSGFIHPGDLVDVLTTMQKPINGRSGEQEFRSKIVLQNVKVLAVGQDMVTQNAKPVTVPVVTLLVSPEESESLALSSMQGKIQLTLRSQADVGEVQTVGISPPELLGGGKAPEPAAPGAKVAARAAPAAKPKEPEVVEVLRGDRLEERKLRNQEGQTQ